MDQGSLQEETSEILIQKLSGKLPRQLELDIHWNSA